MLCKLSIVVYFLATDRQHKTKLCITLWRRAVTTKWLHGQYRTVLARRACISSCRSIWAMQPRTSNKCIHACACMFLYTKNSTYHKVPLLAHCWYAGTHLSLSYYHNVSGLQCLHACCSCNRLNWGALDALLQLSCTLLPSSPLAYPTDSTILLLTSYLPIKIWFLSNRVQGVLFSLIVVFL